MINMIGKWLEVVKEFQIIHSLETIKDLVFGSVGSISMLQV